MGRTSTFMSWSGDRSRLVSGAPPGGPGPGVSDAPLDEYQAAAGRPMLRSSELRVNLAAKRTPAFLEEVRPLIRRDVEYDPVAALDWVEATFLPLLD
jgi:hypothetical protein